MRKHVVNVGMHTAVRQQTENVQGGIKPLALVDRAHQSRILEEIAVLDGLGDAGQLLIYNAACTDVGVANLGVAHLAVRQTNVQTAGIALDEGIFLHQSVQNRGLCQLYGIALCFIIQTEAIQNHQNCCFFLHFFLHSSRNPLPEPQGV